MQSWYMEMIRQLGTQEAEQTLADRLAIRLGDTLWGRCLREWRPAACRTLDDVAERVEALPLRTKTPPSRLVGTSRWLAWAGFDIGGRGLVEELTAAVAPPPVSDPAHAAFTLRVYGVAVCFIRFGLLGFEHCACAETLAASASPASIAGALRALPNPR